MGEGDRGWVTGRGIGRGKEIENMKGWRGVVLLVFLLLDRPLSAAGVIVYRLLAFQPAQGKQVRIRRGGADTPTSLWSPESNWDCISVPSSPCSAARALCIDCMSDSRFTSILS